MLDELRFTLIRKDGDGIPYEIPVTVPPDGSGDCSLILERSMKYWGIARSFSLPLKWTKGAAETIREAMYGRPFMAFTGSMAYCGVRLEKLNKLKLEYETLYEGELDFKTFKDTDFYVDESMIEGGLWQLIKDNSGNDYDIPYYAFGSTVGVNRDAVVYSPIDRKKIAAMRPFTLLKWLVDKMTNGKVADGTYDVKSSILEPGSYWGSILLNTTGKAWRFPATTDDGADISYEEDSPTIITTSFDDFFQSLAAITPVGIGVEVIKGRQTVVLESFDYFFKKESVFFDIGDVKELQITWPSDMRVGKINVSYPEKEFDDNTYTKNEMNTSSKWQVVSFVAGTTEASLESKYRADFAGIAVIVNERIADDNDGWDEDIWWLEVRPIGQTGVIFEMSPGIVSVKNNDGTWPDPQNWYNTFLSPARNLIRNQAIYDNMCYRVGSLGWRFRTGGGNNYRLKSASVNDPIIPGDDYIYEFDDKKIDQGETFYPFEISFSVPYDARFITLANTFYEHTMQFEYKGNTYYAFFKKVELTLTGRGSAKFTLICNSKSDLENLIR